MTNLKPDERPLTAMEAWPLEKRRQDMRCFIENQFRAGKLHIVKPGYTAGTFGVSKAEVLHEIRSRNEILGGEGK